MSRRDAVSDAAAAAGAIGPAAGPGLARAAGGGGAGGSGPRFLNHRQCDLTSADSDPESPCRRWRGRGYYSACVSED